LGGYDNSFGWLTLDMPLTDDLMDQNELLEFANDAVILTDADGAIIYWNQGACRTYGWGKIEALGQNVHALLRTELSGDARNLESSLREQSHWEGELDQVHRNR
jgi:PAS domain S-box-containing protein